MAEYEILHISVDLIWFLLNPKQIFRRLNSLRGVCVYHFWTFQIITMVPIIFTSVNLIWKLLSDFCSSICRQFMRFYICKVKFCCFIQKLLLLIEINEYFYLKKLSVWIILHEKTYNEKGKTDLSCNFS
jgi:hypothetical protein